MTNIPEAAHMARICEIYVDSGALCTLDALDVHGVASSKYFVYR